MIVTGANGFIGTHTIEGLLEKGYNVEAVDVRTERLKQFSDNERFTVHEMDILDKDFKSLIEMGDKVLHLAAIARFETAEDNPQRAVRVNVEGTLNVIQACLERKAQRLVYSSTGSVYSLGASVPIREDAPREPSSLYGLTKKMAEDWIMFYGSQLPYVILRYGYIYGKGKDWGAVGAFLKRLSNNQQPVVFGGDQTNDFVYVKDVVKANLLALETVYTNQAYNIGTARATSIRDVCEYCIKAMKSDLKMKIEPARSFDYAIFVYDISRARTLLRFEPEWNVLNGIANMVKES
ncbi:MAG: NAD-dependent epimerase/dehydratase family protein [Candidatus Bathyarchaeota archaeon]|nr:NAD-dependent epimerase/dehydratase family protein [Candidatus Bathyarchaeota archaeon]MDH5745865.1 NAD-dependent epimerase/dehydratase family protein [Candidatus Bathyarchaeota archaeon]